MQAYLINLARSADRREHMARQLAKTSIQYEIVTAVDGRSLDLTDPAFSHAEVDSSFTANIFGCILSHFKVYQKILDDGVDVALIMEDDIVIPAGLDRIIEKAGQNMSQAEAVLLVYHSFDSVLTMNGAVPLPGGHHLVQVVDKGWMRSAGAYLITREGCARMIKTMLPVRARADEWPTFYHEGAIDRVRCVVPMPVVTSPDLRSTKDNLPPNSVQARLTEIVTSNRIPVLYQLLVSRRKRFLRTLHSEARFVMDEPAGTWPLLKREG